MIMQLAVIAFANTFTKCIYTEQNFTIYMLSSCDL